MVCVKILALNLHNILRVITEESNPGPLQYEAAELTNYSTVQ